MTTQAPDLLPALERVLRMRLLQGNKSFVIEEARAAIDAHKSAHGDGGDDACPCYREGFQAGHEAERRPPGA